jgi:sulfite reductase (NADPH) flavoprotein alpha-component
MTFARASDFLAGTCRRFGRVGFVGCAKFFDGAKDVDAALRKIVQEQGGKSVDEANAYVEQLKNDKRYRRDVY